MVRQWPRQVVFVEKLPYRSLTLRVGVECRRGRSPRCEFREHAKDSVDNQMAHRSIQRQLSLFVTGEPFFCSRRAKGGSRTSADA